MVLSSWVSLPAYRERLLSVYTDALQEQREGSDMLRRRLQVAQFFGQAGLYNQSEKFLKDAIQSETDDSRLADLLHALADVSWKAYQVRMPPSYEACLPSLWPSYHLTLSLCRRGRVGD